MTLKFLCLKQNGFSDRQIAWAVNSDELVVRAKRESLGVKPVYKTLNGWKTSTKGLRENKKLPRNAQRYIKEIEDLTGVNIASISTSPEREDTILIENPFGN